MYDKLKSFLSKYVKLNKLEWMIIKNRSKVVKFKKKEIIHFAGDICQKAYFVNSGLLRGYIIDKKGNEYTWHIFFNDEYAKLSNVFVLDYESFLNNTPSKIFIEVLKDCELIEFDKKDVDFIFNHTKTGQKLGRLFAEEAYSTLHNYIISYTIDTAEDKLLYFLSHSAHWFDLVPQHMIATHLGIRPQSLSRLKKKLNGKLQKEL